ncbi:MAG: glutamine-hydrolyzing carbamoyl-phosphate synthase small subunit [Clostridia bacterium]|nr:glutamine-hydrolyzing carbamoyl-phosphate synthase small subunit [Clostridia bacterium]
MDKIYLILENGTVFEGLSAGARKEAVGELVFTTAMTGYPETVTDPSYFGQIVIQTFPTIGDYGVIPEDIEGEKPYLNGYVVRELCETPSNFRCEGKFEDYLKENGIPCIVGLDTRAITKIVREEGVMNAKISFTPDYDEKIKSYKIENAVKSVDTGVKSEIKTEGADKTVVLWNFGEKRNMSEKLAENGFNVITVPADTSAEEIKAFSPDGIVLSNGPGDPADNTEIIEEIKKLSSIPTFGICLGHQLLALAHGGKTEKLKYGHRGASQPVLDIESGQVYITSQNRGYTVSCAPENSEIYLKNVNDGTCEGLKYKNIPAFSVQFNPSTGKSALDFDSLIADFKKMIKGVK